MRLAWITAWMTAWSLWVLVGPTVLTAGADTTGDESVRSLEQRLERAESSSGRPWKSKVDFAGREAPPEDPREHAERVRLMLDMIALAFESAVTRVITFMFGNSVSTVNFSFLDGVTESHHETSHH